MVDVQTLMSVLQSFGKRRVVVLGDAILDRYLKGRAAGICREAPVPVVGLQTVLEAPGGAANVATNIAALGAQTRLVSWVGADGHGRRLRALIERQGVDCAGVVACNRRTVVKQRLRCDDQLVARFDEGDVGPVDAALAARLAAALSAAAAGCDAVVVSDYGLGLMDPVLREALKRLRGQGLALIVDAKDPGRYRDFAPLVAKPNFAEAMRLLGAGSVPPDDRAGFIARYEDRLLDATGARSVVVTLDAEGALLLGAGGPYRTAGRVVPAAHAAGAGDTFVSALTLALASGADTPVAMDLAAAAADIILAREDTATCSRDELGRELAGQGKFLRESTQIRETAGRLRQEGRRIVFTNGCFDILHRGHITHLERAKALGDVLIVGLNDDDSVRRLKGAGRPLNPLADRIAVVAALGCVDHVLAFAGDTAHGPIEMVRPDLFVKGGDYVAKTLPEVALVEELGGRVRLLEYMDNSSTSGLIERIRRDAKTG